MSLKQAFDEFCSFGKGRLSTGGTKQMMDISRFVRLCKESEMLSPMFTQAEAELLFMKVLPKERKRYVTFKTFKEKIVPGLAKEKEWSDEEVVDQVKSTIAFRSSDMSCNSSMYSNLSLHTLEGDTPALQRSLSRTSSHAQKWERLSSGSLSFSRRRSSVNQPPPPPPPQVQRKFSTGNVSRLSSSYKRMSVSPEPFRRSGSVAFQVIQDNQTKPAQRFSTGFTVIKGFDVEDTILTDDMRKKVDEQEKAIEGQREAYRKLWLQKRNERGLDTSKGRSSSVNKVDTDLDIRYVDSDGDGDSDEES
eukprot:TRINITY_DN10166_c4_g2_i1.p1 TRINITY_DN10166_c4_g2~~TRINITY_DN10166_c4_g2_i1.p1  ORF type:complete len:305 (+),score=57.96 TRINITY_DN10166_c4_g2_i1:72-986(+)